MSKEMIEKKEWLEKEAGEEFFTGLGSAALSFYYRAMHDNGMSVYDADRYAYLNTLIGYDIGAERAKGIISWYEENGGDVNELTAGSLGTLRNICELELNYAIDFSGCVNETPECIKYDWPVAPGTPKIRIYARVSMGLDISLGEFEKIREKAKSGDSYDDFDIPSELEKKFKENGFISSGGDSYIPGSWLEDAVQEAREKGARI